MKRHWRRPPKPPGDVFPDHWEYYVGGPLHRQILPIWGPPYALVGYREDARSSTKDRLVFVYTEDYAEAA